MREKAYKNVTVAVAVLFFFLVKLNDPHQTKKSFKKNSQMENNTISTKPDTLFAN